MSNDERSGPARNDDTNDAVGRPAAGDPVDTPGSPVPAHGGADVLSERAAAGRDDTAKNSDDTMNAKKKGEENQGSFWKELPILIVIALVLAFVIQRWVVQPFHIPSRSMEETLMVGDRVLVNKLVYQFRDIERGDVIVFNGGGSWDEGSDVVVPSGGNPISRFFTWVGQQMGAAPTGKDYIKRVIGLPGDTVECCDEQNRLMVNGVPLDEDYLYPDSLATHQEFGPVTVPEGHLWVMGDHRAISYDSRMHQSDNGGGSIPEESVVGHAFVIVWPPENIGLLSSPDTFAELNENSKVADQAAAALPLALGLAGAVPVHLLGRGVIRRWRSGGADGHCQN
ncbi:signal peptidase I [Thermobifida fusca]|jgi:signal peptidase I|uniref:Signal peptidase I n=3 Tax=Thermobifida fusca TaxID=2021 RepID=A0A9P2TDB6_THEFU|nr:signal peptidase I [Thermobifida fusca]AAZ54705.1 signal peptidase I. Serine peptidase. MEROPS family S26A [Thermobifida fusca YX]EOR72216.1 signal peptidase I [Thermobifida fusca TM51]MDD6792596.1 signal peptidase I [Thermobifida fusca]QOS60232.1 signal peptidase I [Thermobifida fusca]